MAVAAGIVGRQPANAKEGGHRRLRACGWAGTTSNNDDFADEKHSIIPIAGIKTATKHDRCIASDQIPTPIMLTAN